MQIPFEERQLFGFSSDNFLWCSLSSLMELDPGTTTLQWCPKETSVLQ